MSARATSLAHAPAIAAETRAAARIEQAKTELLSFPALLLPQLPVHVRIGVQATGFAHAITLYSGIVPAPEQGSRNGLSFDGQELAAIAQAVQAERMWPADFKGFCLHKLHDSSFRLGARLALACAQPSAGPGLPLGRVLRWLDLDLIDFAFVQDCPPENGRPENGGPVLPLRPDFAAA